MGTIMNEFEMQLQALQAQPGTPGTKRMQGTVTEWNPRGFGFVVTNDGSRAYVHNSQCGGEHLMEGEVILANIVSDPRTPGKWCAQNVERGVSPFEIQEDPSSAKRPRLN